jgi:hypothetical protein
MAAIEIQEKIEQAWQEKCHAMFDDRHEKRVYLSTREMQILAKRDAKCPIYLTEDKKLAYIKVDFNELIKLAK